MRLRSLLAAAALLGALALPSFAAAQSLAYSAPGRTNMRAGPGTEFPIIAQILDGSQVNVIGCLQNYAWCDAVVQGIRGWVSSTRLEFAYGSQRLPVYSYYTYFRAPIIRFDLGYWDLYYRDRSFYRDRARWHRQDRGWREDDRPRDSDRRWRDRDRDRDEARVPRRPDGEPGGGRRNRDYDFLGGSPHWEEDDARRLGRRDGGRERHGGRRERDGGGAREGSDCFAAGGGNAC